MKQRTIPALRHVIGVGAVVLLGLVCLAQCSSGDSGRSGMASAVVRVPMDVRDGLPRVACRINDRQTVWLILDTGSQVSVFERQSAENCGVVIEHGPSGKVMMAGAGGSEQGFRALLDSVRLAGRTWVHQPCLVRSGDTRISGTALFGSRRVVLDLMGVGPLREKCLWVAFDFPRRCVELSFGRPFVPPADGTQAFPLAFRDGLPYMTLNSSGVSWEALVDTGSTAAIELDPATALRLRLEATAEKNQTIRTGIGDSRFGTRVIKSRLKTLDGFVTCAAPMDVLVVNDVPKVGCGLLKQFRVTLDFERSEMWLQK